MFFAEATSEAGNAIENVPLTWEGARTFFENELVALGEVSLDWGLRVVGALAIFFIGRKIVKLISGVITKAFEKTHMTPTLNKFLTRLINGILQIIVIVAVLPCIGVETASIVAMLAAASFAIGMALQGSLSNFAAGILIVILRPFQVNDSIEAGGVIGVVEEIGIFATLIRTGDNRLVHVPNSVLTSQAVTNISAKPTRRVDLVIGISYGDNIKTAKDIIAGILAGDSRILAEPTPLIAVSNLGENSVDLFVRPWVKTDEYWAVRFDLIEKIKIELEAGGCSIPFPQRDVHVHQVPAK